MSNPACTPSYSASLSGGLPSLYAPPRKKKGLGELAKPDQDKSHHNAIEEEGGGEKREKIQYAIPMTNQIKEGAKRREKYKEAEVSANTKVGVVRQECEFA